MMVCSVLAKRMNTSEKRKVKWLNPNCHPTMAQTMNSPAQHRMTVERRMMILAWEEAGVFGEKESYRWGCECVRLVLVCGVEILKYSICVYLFALVCILFNMEVCMLEAKISPN